MQVLRVRPCCVGAPIGFQCRPPTCLLLWLLAWRSKRCQGGIGGPRVQLLGPVGCCAAQIKASGDSGWPRSGAAELVQRSTSLSRTIAQQIFWRISGAQKHPRHAEGASHHVPQCTGPGLPRNRKRREPTSDGQAWLHYRRRREALGLYPSTGQDHYSQELLQCGEARRLQLFFCLAASPTMVKSWIELTLFCFSCVDLSCISLQEGVCGSCQRKTVFGAWHQLRSVGWQWDGRGDDFCTLWDCWLQPWNVWGEGGFRCSSSVLICQLSALQNCLTMMCANSVYLCQSVMTEAWVRRSSQASLFGFPAIFALSATRRNWCLWPTLLIRFAQCTE